MVFKKNITVFFVSFVFVMSVLCVFCTFLCNRYEAKNFIRDYQEEQLTFIDYAFNDHVKICESSFSKSKELYSGFLKEQALALNANLNNILLVLSNKANDDENKDNDDLKDTNKLNIEAVLKDEKLLTKVKNYQNNLHSIGYDFLIVKDSKILLETINKDIIQAKTQKFIENKELKDYYLLKTNDKDYLSFVFTNDSNYNFVFIKDITALKHDLIKDKKHLTFFVNLFKNIVNTTSFSLLLVDGENGDILKSSANLNINNIGSSNFATLKDGTINASTISLNNNNYYVQARKLQSRNYYILSLCDESYISAFSFSLYYLVIPLLSTLIAYIASIFLGKNIKNIMHSEIDKLNTHISQTILKTSDIKSDDSKDHDESNTIQSTVVSDAMDSINDITKELDEKHKKELSELKDKVQKDSTLATIKSIQQANLPNEKTIPSSKFLDITSYLLNGDKVGNVYNIIRLDEDNIAFILSNIDTDNYIDKGFMLSYVNSSAIAQLKQGLKPNVILQNINKDICSRSIEGLEITLYIMVLNEKTGNFINANAGFLDPLILSGCKVLDFDKVQDAVIGAMDNITYAEQKGKLNYDDSLLFLSLGVIDTKNSQNESYGIEHITSASTNLHVTDKDNMIQGLLKDLIIFKGQRSFVSDVTLICVHRKSVN